MVTLELVAPRVSSVPAGDDDLGREAVEFARRVGLTLDPEQELVLERSLRTRDDGRLAAFEVGLLVPRQNGKGEVLIARELFGLFRMGERQIVHSAHEFKTSARHFARLEQVIKGCPELLSQVKRAPSGRTIGFRYGNGDEAVELANGDRIDFRTRTKSGMRGFDDVGLVVLDEAMIIGEAAHGSMLPTLRASTAPRGPQVWYTGSAVDQDIHEHGVVFARMRERGHAGDGDVCWFEWSLDYDHPDEIPDEVVSDPEMWRRVNFAIERGRVQEEHMAREFRSMSSRAFAIELLSVGDWPATDETADALIPAEAWADSLDESSVLVDPVCIGFDVSPDRRTSIAAAGLNEAGQLHVEVIHSREGTGWVVERLEQLYRRHEVVEIVCDGYGPAAAIARRVDEAGITVRRVGAAEYATACGVFVDLVGERTLRHIGQQELNQAVRGSRTRPLVDRFAWSRTKSTSDQGPLIAGSLAVWSAAEKDLGGVAIF